MAWLFGAPGDQLARSGQTRSTIFILFRTMDSSDGSSVDPDDPQVSAAEMFLIRKYGKLQQENQKLQRKNAKLRTRLGAQSAEIIRRVRACGARRPALLRRPPPPDRRDSESAQEREDIAAAAMRGLLGCARARRLPRPPSDLDWSQHGPMQGLRQPGCRSTGASGPLSFVS